MPLSGRCRPGARTKLQKAFKLGILIAVGGVDIGRIGWLVIERLFGAHDRSSDLRRSIANPDRAQGDGRDPEPGPGR